MQFWTNTQPLNPIHPIICEQIRPGDLFLDIETTGLARARHQIYLIGMATIVDNNIIYVNQIFADSPTDEHSVLAHFSEVLRTFAVKRIITFNGNSFDLPFLLTRATLHDISLSFDAFELFDIYKEVTKRKNMLQLQDYRQKTVEQLLGIDREDQYSGAELIKVYERLSC